METVRELDKKQRTTKGNNKRARQETKNNQRKQNGNQTRNKERTKETFLHAQKALYN